MNEPDEVTPAPWELVTAPTAPPERLAGEVGELQETWQAFQELLHKSPVAETPSWTAALVDELEPTSVVAQTIAPTPTGRSTTIERVSWRMVVVALTMAGCLATVALVGLSKLSHGVGVGLATTAGKQAAREATATVTSRSGGERPVESDNAKSSAGKAIDAPAVAPPRGAATDYVASSWDDPLDWQLDQATQSLATMRERWRSRASDYEMWQLQLEQLRADLDGGAL